MTLAIESVNEFELCTFRSQFSLYPLINKPFSAFNRVTYCKIRVEATAVEKDFQNETCIMWSRFQQAEQKKTNHEAKTSAPTFLKEFRLCQLCTRIKSQYREDIATLTLCTPL